MVRSHSPTPEEVEQLLLNAQLRDELEPFLDESVMRLASHRVPTKVANEYLASMLAWEKAPVMPICQWFQPELRLPSPDQLDHRQLQELLWTTIGRLYEQRIVLDFTDHLSDRELYRLILRDILPCQVKKIENSSAYLHWDCANVDDEPQVWLTYYASDEEREEWARHHAEPLPDRGLPPYHRDLPREPL